jgi:hypothetical protein
MATGGVEGRQAIRFGADDVFEKGGDGQTPQFPGAPFLVEKD